MRRRIPVLAAAVLALVTSTGCGSDFGLRFPGSLPVKDPGSFDTPLPIPPLAESRLVDGVRVFSLDAQEGSAELLPGIQTPTWGFNGDHLGPTLRAARGEAVAVEVTNRLPETTTVHWHGMHLPPAMDGGPHQPIQAGASWRPAWTIDQPAATLWYHPHPHGATEKHVYRGLAGMFILDDPAAPAFGLPDRYGVDDIPVIVQDKRFDADGGLVQDSQGNEIGLLGDTILTNGAFGAVQEVTTERVRLRLLNGSTARTYDFAIDDGREVALVATDGGLLEAPHRTDHVRLSPGERAEIVVDMEPGSDAMLISRPPDLGDVLLPGAYGGQDEFEVLRLRAAPALQASAQVADAFDSFGIDSFDATRTRAFEVQNREINGRRMAMDRIDEVIELGTTEIWEVTNRDGFPHNWHVHDVQFEVLSIDGEPPPPELGGRKDTVYLEPRRLYRLIMRFEDYADERHPYMMHCHLLLHEDQGLMAQFLVTRSGLDPEPGQFDPPAGEHGSH
ncbi:multicopper oxidase family protein [Lysobacter korlensis]|uniref:Multicopper oxidase family protein n=1 Tax=Lysobacter korlensis TaxID=553636 RepID=A0ABV6RSY9_9GAMM